MTHLDPTEKLAQLCDGDRRKTNASTAALAAGITAASGDTVAMPDPYGERARHDEVMGLMRAYLEAQPNAQAVRSAGRRLTAAIAFIGEEVAKGARR